MGKHTCRMLIVIACIATGLPAAEPIAGEAVESPAAIAPDEPYAKEFSPALAARYLDRAALDWQETHACTSCHTMFPYMMARPTLGAVSPQSVEVRQFFEDVVAAKREAMPGYSCDDVEGAVAVGLASAMALNDRWGSGKLHPLTRQALDRMWTLQRSDGGWSWPFRDTPPLKIDEHYGVTLAAVGTGMAPDDYAKSPAAKTGMERVRRFLERTPAVSLHQRAMMLWASAYFGDLLPVDAQQRILADLLDVQRPDGGWSMANLVDNVKDPSLSTERVANALMEEGYASQFLVYIGRGAAYKSSLASDGYATGFVVFVTRQAGLPASDARLQRGLAWLKSNQRASGRWYTPSQAWHTQHLIANAGTAYAVLALFACGELPAPR
jgi:squalene-hopene/tetraprenyl-beta-curcumene cyclase